LNINVSTHESNNNQSTNNRGEVMKRVLSLATVLAVLVLLSMYGSDTAYAQSNGNQYGKGATQWGSFDDDGDGIPNGQDPDFVKPANGSGRKFGKMKGGATMNGKGFGGGNGSGNCGLGPRNGSGLGPGNGTCDGTGPKGRGRGGN
jgi:hypothetical protein